MNGPNNLTTGAVDRFRPVRLPGSAGAGSSTDRLRKQSAAPTTKTVTLVITLLVASILSWRRGVYFSGSLDPIVVGKAGLGGIALAISLYVFLRTPSRASIHGLTVLLVAAYLITTVLGAWTGGNLVTSAIVAIRVGMVLATMGLLIASCKAEDLVRIIVQVFAAAGALAVITGLPNVDGGRLVGGVPPLTANDLAFLFGVVALYLLWRVAIQRATRWHWFGASGCFAIVFLTGSRTGLLVLVAAVLVVLAQMRTYSRPAFSGLILSVPVLVYVVFGTDVLWGFLERGGAENVATLSSRTIAWDAALSMDGPWWSTLLGGGLAMKSIPVPGQYWDSQILDSSWVSALVQGGWVAVVLVGILTLEVGISALRSPSAWRPLLTGLYIFLVGGSPLESGLFDATGSFIAFVTVAMVSHLVRQVPFNRDEGAPGPDP